VRTSIFGRPRPLPGHRRAATYTLICEEPVKSGSVVDTGDPLRLLVRRR